MTGLIEEFYPSGHVGLAVEITVPLQQPEVVIHYGSRTDFARLLDVPYGGRQAIVLEEAVNVIQDLLASGRKFLIQCD